MNKIPQLRINNTDSVELGVHPTNVKPQLH